MCWPPPHERHCLRRSVHAKVSAVWLPFLHVQTACCCCTENNLTAASLGSVDMKPSVVWVCMALWAWATVFPAAEGGAMTLWRLVLVESSWFKETVVQAPRNLSLILCGAACMRHDWCRLWRHDEPRWCLLTSLTVSGSYQPSQSDGALSCYIRHQVELTFGASITSSKHYHSNKKLRLNLVDGVYNGDIDETALVIKGSGVFAWFLVDVGVVVPVSEVVLVAQPNTNAANDFKDIEVRVGSVKMSGDFTSYSLLGTFTGPGEPEKIVVLRPAAPLTGRFISIQRTTDGRLQIAHLEIR